MGKYTRLFIDETRRHLESLEEILRRPAGSGTAEGSCFEGRRLAHSIKGMALFEEQPPMADLAYAIEKAFERAHGGGIGEPLVAGLREGLALLSAMIREVENGGSAVSDPGPVLARLEGAPAEGGRTGE